MKLESLNDLLINELRDLYSAENQLTKALPKMAKAARSDDLREAFQGHLEETQHQVERLDTIFEQLGVSGKGKKCQAMAGLIEEGKEIIDMDMRTPSRMPPSSPPPKKSSTMKLPATARYGPLLSFWAWIRL